MAATTKGTKDTYGLTRDATETARLDGQHVVWKTNIGFLLHPRIAETLPDDAVVGEVGTGTGVWLLDLAREQHGKQGWNYRGLDMSAAQFPSHPPPSVGFATLNILDPVPAELENTFDVLHLRLLILGLPAGTWTVASENILKLLKPGGWVQWEEMDIGDMKAVQNFPGASTRAARELLLDLMAALGDSGTGFRETERLAETVKQAGFVDVLQEIFASDRVADTREEYSKTIIGATGGMMTMLVAREKAAGGTSDWETGAKRELYDAMVEELSGGKAYWRADLRVVHGRKAS